MKLKSFKNFLSEGLVKVDEVLINKMLYGVILSYIKYFKDTDNSLPLKIRKIPLKELSSMFKDELKFISNKTSVYKDEDEENSYYMNLYKYDLLLTIDFRINKNTKASLKGQEIRVYPFNTQYINYILQSNMDSLLSDLKSSIKHELVHHVEKTKYGKQYNNPKSMRAYKDYEKDDDAYLASPIEFEAQLSSHVDEFVNIILRHNIEASEIKDKINMYVNRMQFFIALKKYSSTRYNSAIKKFYSEVMKRLKL